ncbi:TIGR03085 family metal-binding protein [Kitasatospora sp. NBC_01287]|uniref:TIGR03085 family metal-binding protein n=1 Tax=Kitasatospora sp. NBC_01287 TaxID=2903573 RepID=UPI002252570A|nr:TIGR03085 family metal-binding protein [Kitasatospora sp. NBC_01287]MCX4750760.1 TIGR03085 family metal-binding protein [Kitasatospora sp. NBC_01287]
MSNHARGERERLAGLLAAAGPDGPTLCAGWRTRDLAAHLVVREGRPDAAPGIQLRRLAGWTARVQAGYARRPYEELVARFAAGPPRLSPFALPGADEAANTVEYFVHAEDVRRAVAWEPRPLGPALAEVLWRRLPMLARFELGRRTPVRLVLDRPDGANLTVAQRRAGSVRVTGEPAELLLFAFGRGAQAAVTVRGPADEVALLRSAVALPAESAGSAGSAE